jgi:rubrerythrin
MDQVESLLEVMIEFENDTVLFYQMIRTAVSDAETLKLLDTIISDEKEHADELQRFLDAREETEGSL